MELSFNGNYSYLYHDDNQLSLYPGKLWCISGDTLGCEPLSGWDYAEDFIWPNTDTLYMIGKQKSL